MHSTVDCIDTNEALMPSDGPVLVHTTGGELLRCLEGGDGAPGHLALSREGLVVAIYGRGHVSAFTMNGCRLRHQQHTDNVQVCMYDIFL